MSFANVSQWPFCGGLPVSISALSPTAYFTERCHWLHHDHLLCQIYIYIKNNNSELKLGRTVITASTFRCQTCHNDSCEEARFPLRFTFVECLIPQTQSSEVLKQSWGWRVAFTLYLKLNTNLFCQSAWNRNYPGSSADIQAMTGANKWLAAALQSRYYHDLQVLLNMLSSFVQPVSQKKTKTNSWNFMWDYNDTFLKSTHTKDTDRVDDVKLITLYCGVCTYKKCSCKKIYFTKYYLLDYYCFFWLYFEVKNRIFWKWTSGRQSWSLTCLF